MKRYLLARVALLTALLFVGDSLLWPVKADTPCTVTASNLTPTEINNRISAAANGDVICLPAGEGTWTSGVNFPSTGKAVEVRGAGPFYYRGAGPRNPATRTIIHINTGPGSAVSLVNSDSGHNTLSNIWFEFDQNATAILPPAALIVFGPQGGPSGAQGQISIVHHNTYWLLGRSGDPHVHIVQSKGGLTYRNVIRVQTIAPNFINTNINGFGHIITEPTDTGSWWDSANTIGSADDGTKNLYIEDSKFTGMNVLIDQNTSSRVVGRYNEMHSSSTSDHGYDSSVTGNRHAEWYRNHFYCDSTISMAGYIGKRGGFGHVWENAYETIGQFSPCNFINNNVSGGTGYVVDIYKLRQCEPIAGWPGAYPDTYPTPHQSSWGWVNGSNQTVGDSSHQNDPGGSGFQQAIEMTRSWSNYGPGLAATFAVAGTGLGECRAMAYSNASKSSGTTMTHTAYVSAGQDAVVIFGDLVGGSAPTISSSCNNSWAALNGGTNGVRLSAWSAHMSTSCRMTVTVTFGSSALARAGSLVVMRGLAASPQDKNPAADATLTASPYDAPSTGTLTQATEIVLGYFALNGPSVFTIGSSTCADAGDTTGYGSCVLNDNVQPGPNDLRAVSSGTTGPGAPGSFGITGLGINGTNGGTATDNVTTAVTYRVVNSTSAVQPRILDRTANRNGVGGVVTFKLGASGASGLDLQVSDFIQSGREYCASDDDSCKPVGYTPYTYPHPLATVKGADPAPVRRTGAHHRWF